VSAAFLCPKFLLPKNVIGGQMLPPFFFMGQQAREGRKVFFFEKKKQKTFAIGFPTCLQNIGRVAVPQE
jgi:hypothetical protein